MSKFTERKTGTSTGTIAGVETPAAGKYTNEELLRRVTLANLLFESNYYQKSDEIMNQIENLVKVVDPQIVVDLAVECRYDQKLRHTPLWLLLLVNEFHKGHPIKEAISKVSTRPDMLMDLLGMLKVRQGKIKPIPKGIKNGLAMAFDHYDEYQIAKYKKSNMDISLVDIVNLTHPSSTPKNEKALKALVDGTLEPADTWETALSQGKDKKETFLRLIEEEKLGSMAILRNLRGMKEAGLSRADLKKAIGQVNSQWLTPLNFLAAQRAVPEFSMDIDEAMAKSFASYKIPGVTVIAIDVSGSMGGITSQMSNFSRMDLAFAMAALATHIFEDPILVATAGNDSTCREDHRILPNGLGLGIFSNAESIARSCGGGGIFTHQLCEWLKKDGYASDADRLVVISDSQDIDVSRGRKDKPDTSPYKTSYIIDISTHTHGIKTGVWTAEINGWSDKLFHYIAALESKQ